MIFADKIINLKDGRKCVLRNVEGSDAEGMLEYLRIASGESPFLLRNADEVNFTIEGEIQLLERKHSDDMEVMMAAEVDGKIAGNCGVAPKGYPRRIRHRCGFAIALQEEYCNLGIGREMMFYAFDLARQIGYEQMELEVVEGNDRAKHLYEKLGFTDVGRNIRALKYDDGSYRDEILMYKVL